MTVLTSGRQIVQRSVFFFVNSEQVVVQEMMIHLTFPWILVDRLDQAFVFEKKKNPVVTNCIIVLLDCSLSALVFRALIFCS